MPKSDPFVMKIVESLEQWGDVVSPMSVKLSKKTRDVVKCALCGNILYADEPKIAFKRQYRPDGPLYACSDRKSCERRIAARKSKCGKRGKRAEEIRELKNAVTF